MSKKVLFSLIGLAVLIFVVYIGVFAWLSPKIISGQVTNQLKTDLGTTSIIPTSPFYGLKLSREQFAINTTSKAEDRSLLYISLAEERIKEVNSLIKQKQNSDTISVLVKYSEQVNQAVKDSTNSAQLRVTISRELMRQVSDLVLYYSQVSDLDARIGMINTIDRETARVQILINKLDQNDRLETQKAVTANQLEANSFLRAVASDVTLPTNLTFGLKQRFLTKDTAVADAIKKLTPTPASASASKSGSLK